MVVIHMKISGKQFHADSGKRAGGGLIRLVGHPALRGVAMAILVVVCGLSESHAADSTAQKLMYENRSAYRSAIDELPGKNNSESVWLKRYLENLDQKKISDSPEDRERALYGLIRVSKHQRGKQERTGIIEDASTVAVLVAALRDESPPVRDAALNALTWETRLSDLRRYSSEIKSGLGSDLKSDDLLLLARLPLSKEEQQNLSSRYQLDPEVRARLGDKSAELELVTLFKGATDYEAMRKLAHKLSYIGSDRCARALVEGLQSNVAFSSRYEDRSIRIEILLSLGRIFPDVRLFTTYAVALSDSNDAAFDRRYGLANYISDIDAWVRKHFGQPAWGKEPVWFIRFHAVPILKPQVVR
jgi:hypothetical protein